MSSTSLPTSKIFGSNKPGKLSLELDAYFSAVRKHMQAKLRTTNIKSNAKDLQKDNQRSKVSESKVPDQVSYGKTTKCEDQLMTDDVPGTQESKNMDSDNSNNTDDEDLHAITETLEYFQKALNDIRFHSIEDYQSEPSLLGDVDQLVLICSRALRLIHTKFCLSDNTEPQMIQKHTNQIDTICQIFTCLFKTPNLSSKIAQKSFSDLLESVMPYYLNFDSDSKIRSKIDQSIISSAIAMQDLTQLLLALLQLILCRLGEFNLNSHLFGAEYLILVQWIELLAHELNDERILNLDFKLVFAEIDIMLQVYPGSQLESQRDFRLLVALREIIFKVVNCFGNQVMWDILRSFKTDFLDTKMLHYVNIAFEQRGFLGIAYSDNVFDDDLIELVEPHYKRVNFQGENSVPEISKPDYCDPIEGYSIIGKTDKEIIRFMGSLNSLACTTDLDQAKLDLDYLNQKFGNLASEVLGPKLTDLLIRACLRQYRLFTIRYFAPSSNVRQPSDQALQIFHSTTSLLEQIFTSSSILLKFVTTETVYDLLMISFSFRLTWATRAFESEFAFTDLQSFLRKLEISKLICICIRMWASDLRALKSYSYRIYEQYCEFMKDLLYELVTRLQYVKKEELAKFDWNSIFYGIVGFMRNLRMNAEEIVDEMDTFLYFPDSSDRTRPLTLVAQLTLAIVRQRLDSIWRLLPKKQWNADVNIQILGHFITQALLKVKNPEYSRSDILGFLKNNGGNCSALTEAQIRRAASIKRLQLVPVPMNISDELSNLKLIIIPQIENIRYIQEVFPLEKMFQSWKGKLVTYVQYHRIYGEFVNLIILTCAELMKKAKHFEKLNSNEFVLIWDQMLGDMIRQLFSPHEYRLGHDHMTEKNLQTLITANIGVMYQYPRAKENLKSYIQWIWDLHEALVKYSPPGQLLPIPMNVLTAFLGATMDPGSSRFSLTEKNAGAQVRMIQLCSSMIESTCDRMFFSVGACYTPEMVFSGEFNLEEFLVLVDTFMNAYPLTRLEQERDYRLWELMKRVLERLLQIHGTDIQLYYRKIGYENADHSPVIQYFRQILPRT